jgi:hypothetical protein
LPNTGLGLAFYKQALLNELYLSGPGTSLALSGTVYLIDVPILQDPEFLRIVLNRV